MCFKKIIGEKVYLSPRDINDAKKYTEWVNNYDTAKYINQITRIIDIQYEEEYLAKRKYDSYDFAIVDKETDELIGSIGLMNIDYIDRTAELGIFIGVEDHLSKGYGSDAIRILLDYGFNQLNLHNIMLKVYDFNKRAIKAYEKCGFKKYGEWKESHYFEGKYHNEILMNILKDDYNKNK